MTQKKIIIIKLGGSIVTLKHRSRPALRRAHIRRIALFLAKIYDPKKHALILIHGAGSFGHAHAHAHNLSEGTKGHPEKLWRAVENQSLNETLNAEIATLCVRSGLPVSGLPTRACVVNTQGKLATLDTGSIRAALRAGAIPLLQGDMVFDAAWGLSICSGDVLAARLAADLSAEAVFFASDVDGIFSQDPHLFPGAVLIKTTTLAEITEGTLKLGASHNIDVTGGLAKKFTSFQRTPSLKHIYLFNGLLVKNFSYLFDTKKFCGTKITV